VLQAQLVVASEEVAQVGEVVLQSALAPNAAMATSPVADARSSGIVAALVVVQPAGEAAEMEEVQLPTSACQSSHLFHHVPCHCLHHSERRKILSQGAVQNHPRLNVQIDQPTTWIVPT
jgi:hypothetical protein